MGIKVHNAASFTFCYGCFENNSPTVVTSSRQIRFVVTIRTDNRHLTINMTIWLFRLFHSCRYEPLVYLNYLALH